MQVERKKEKDGPLIMNENHSADCLIVFYLGSFNGFCVFVAKL